MILTTKWLKLRCNSGVSIRKTILSIKQAILSLSWSRGRKYTSRCMYEDIFPPTHAFEWAYPHTIAKSVTKHHQLKVELFSNMPIRRSSNRNICRICDPKFANILSSVYMKIYLFLYIRQFSDYVFRTEKKILILFSMLKLFVF